MLTEFGKIKMEGQLYCRTIKSSNEMLG